MKKSIFLTCLFTLGLFSCSNEELMDGVQDRPSDEVTTRSPVTAKYSYLGWGYDVTGDYLDGNSIRMQVIDIEKFDNDPKMQGRYYADGQHRGYGRTYSGVNSEDFLQEIKTTHDFSSGPSIGIDKIVDISGTLGYVSEVKKKESFSSKYSFSRSESVKQILNTYIHAEVDMLTPYISTIFLSDLKKYTPAKIVELYGTHVLLGVKAGGRLTVTYKSIVKTTLSRTEKKRVVSAGSQAKILIFGGKTDQKYTTETINELKTHNEEAETHYFYHGGTNSGNVSTANPSLSTWESSVTKDNAALIDIDWKKAYPIYDFVKDPVKKAQIKTAVENYIKSKKIQMLELTPVYQYCQHKDYDHYYTTTWKGDSFGGPQGHVYEGVAFYVPAKASNDTKPVYQYLHPKLDHYYTAIWKGDLIGGPQGHKYQAIAFQVPKTNVEGTVPIYEYAHPKMNHYYTPIWKGSSFGGSKGHTYTYIPFYAYPPEAIKK